MSTNIDGQLTSEWQRYDWRESLFAPNISILQALTKSGATASGVGDNRDLAFQGCLSETAEALAIAALSSQSNGSGNSPPAYDSRDGIAAHTEFERAQIHALYEALERSAVSKWWLGSEIAKRVPDDWLMQTGLTNLLAKHRAGAAIKRLTGLWYLDLKSGVHIMISQSHYENKQDRILGFGVSACPVEAAQKALRENLLMELNLVEVLAARSGYSTGDVSRIEKKIASYATRASALLTDDGAQAPNLSHSVLDLDKLISLTIPTPELIDITPHGQHRAVCLCRLSNGPAFKPDGQGSPFM